MDDWVHGDRARRREQKRVPTLRLKELADRNDAVRSRLILDGCFQRFASASAIVRAIASEPPPAPVGVITRTVRSGHAIAPWIEPGNSTVSAMAMRDRFTMCAAVEPMIASSDGRFPSGCAASVAGTRIGLVGLNDAGKQFKQSVPLGFG